MACFLVPATEAIVTTVASKTMKKKGTFTKKLGLLSKFLWGGSALLMFEHIWHGEVQPFFPFLTACENPIEISGMLHEMSTVGVTMAVAVTAFWGILTVASKLANKTPNTLKAVEVKKN